MSLNCAMDFDDADWYYEQANDFAPLATKRARRCCSCNKLIKVGEEALKHHLWRGPENDIEERIHGDEVPMAPKYMCEDCGGIAITLTELGYNTPPGDDMRELAKEYREQQQFDADYTRGWAAGTAGLPLPDDASEGFKSGHRSGAWNRPKEAA